MSDTTSTTIPEAGPTKNIPKFKRGALVRVNRIAYESSIEALASDPSPAEYIFEGPGELLTIKGEYAQIRWRRPVPDVWLPVNQLESWT